MIRWSDHEEGEGKFKSSFFRDDAGSDELIVYAINDDLKACAEICVEAFNNLPASVINEICEQLINCAKRRGIEEEFELPALETPQDILNHCWFVALYVDMASGEDEAAYAVEGEGEWGENIGFVIRDNKVIYVGTDYLDHMRHGE